MAQKFSNNAQSVLPAALASGATSFSVKSGDGGQFPVLSAGDFFMVTVVDASGTVEIMKCTARSGDTMTVERAQEGTNAAAFPAGSLVQHRLTAGAFTGELARVENKADEALNTAYLRRGPLPSDTTHNLDDWGVNEVGIWYQGSGSWTSAAQNYPVAMAGVLEVLPRTTGRVVQRYIQYLDGRTYIRGQSNAGTWSSWQRLDTVSERDNAIGVLAVGFETELLNYALKANLEWLSRPLCEPFPLWDHIPGCPIPPTGSPDFRFIKLTAGDAYNAGVLTNESVTGTGPLVIATAEISLAGSPVNGATVHLINTERRALRAGESGVVEQDTLQSHAVQTLQQHGRTALSGSQDANGTGLRSPNNWGGPPASLISDALGGTLRLAEETRMKNVGATYYMRVK